MDVPACGRGELIQVYHVHGFPPSVSIALTTVSNSEYINLG